MNQEKIKELSEFLTQNLCRDYYVAHDFSFEDRCSDGHIEIVIKEILSKCFKSKE